jgi:hypothetical protein
MRMSLETINAVLSQITSDWSNGVDYGMERPGRERQVHGREPGVERGRHGVRSDRRRWHCGPPSGCSACRLGRIHPGNTLLTHELVGKLSLGINRTNSLLGLSAGRRLVRPCQPEDIVTCN